MSRPNCRIAARQSAQFQDAMEKQKAASCDAALLEGLGFFGVSRSGGEVRLGPTSRQKGGRPQQAMELATAADLDPALGPA